MHAIEYFVYHVHYQVNVFVGYSHDEQSTLMHVKEVFWHKQMLADQYSDANYGNGVMAIKNINVYR